MTYFRFPAPGSMTVALIAIATAACQDSTAPATTRNSTVPTAANAWLVAKPKKNAPVIQSVQLSQTWLGLNDGTAAVYTVTINNPITKTNQAYTDVSIQGEIRQGDVVVGAGGGQIKCGNGPDQLLPMGMCVVENRTISTIPGAALLTSGPAIFAVRLHSWSDAFDPVTFTQPVILGEALATP